MAEAYRSKTVHLSDDRCVHAAMLDNGRYGIVYRNAEGIFTEFSLAPDAALATVEILEALLRMPNIVKTPEGSDYFPDWNDPHPKAQGSHWVLVKPGEET